MVDIAVARRLASIVAVDMAGYSRRSEADEEAAISAVTALKARVAATVEAHGGRVFNTAGDGFMLEFPTASGALAAAEQIASSSDPPVRVGVHLGEVSPTDSGDLLGHGVNVAARIQQMASPGAVLVSGDVKRAARGPLGARLKPQGSVRLDKMSETLPVFALGAAVGRHTKGRRRSLKAPLVASAGAALGALAAFALWPGHGLVPAAYAVPSRLAILPFEPLTSSPQEHAFATGLADELQSVLTASQLPLVSREDAQSLRGSDQAAGLRKLGVRLLLDGTVMTDRDTLTARVHLDDPAKHVTVWSTELSGPASTPDALEAQVGARAIAVLSCAGKALRAHNGLSDAEALALYLRACDLFEANSGVDDVQEAYGVLDAFRQVSVRAPGFAPAHSALARFLAYYSSLLPEPATQAEAEREARRAVAIDPKDGDAYAALSLLRPVYDYAGRERFLDQALAADSAGPFANWAQANLLLDVGRFKEAAGFLERAVAANPLSLDATTDVILVANGQTAAGDAELDRLYRLWPHSGEVWYHRMQIYGMEGQWDQALAVLDDRRSRPKGFTDREVDLMRTSAVARKLRTPAAVSEARRQLLSAPVRLQWALPGRIVTLADLGLVDDAFRVADGYSKTAMSGFDSPQFLFYPNTSPAMRHDLRFMAFAAKLGLVDYWRTTGKWPDFCAEPALPYDCKAEAAKIVGVGHG